MLGEKAGLCVQSEKLASSHLRPAPVLLRASTSQQMKRMLISIAAHKCWVNKAKICRDITIRTLLLRWAGTGRVVAQSGKCHTM